MPSDLIWAHCFSERYLANTIALNYSVLGTGRSVENHGNRIAREVGWQGLPWGEISALHVRVKRSLLMKEAG